MADFQFDSGEHVRDVVTGFAGIVTGRVDYITGCNQYLVQAKATKDGAVLDGRWLDEQRLVRANGKRVVLPDGHDVRPGADMPAPVK